MTRSRILCLVLLGALAVRLCSSFTAAAATHLPLRLNSTEPNEQQVLDFTISSDSQWVVYEAHSQENIARRVTKIDRTPSLTQLLPPRLKVFWALAA